MVGISVDRVTMALVVRPKGVLNGRPVQRATKNNFSAKLSATIPWAAYRRQTDKG